MEPDTEAGEGALSALAFASIPEKILDMATILESARCFLDGFGSALSIVAPPPPSYLTTSDADDLKSDWRAVGMSIQVNIAKFQEEQRALQQELNV